MCLFAKAGVIGLIALAGLSMTAPSSSAAPTSLPQDPQAARICSPLVAIRKARDLGLRHATIAAITPRRVVVAGNRHGPQRVSFANLPGCPLLRR